MTNTEKGRLGEEAFKEALPDFPIEMNISFGDKQNDIDHLVLSNNSIIFNECKNTKESFFMWYSWFTSHVVDRFAAGLPIAQHYARCLGYPIKNIVFTLTIPCLNTEPIVKESLKGLKINVIQTGKQVLKDEDKKEWCDTVRSQILSVINNRASNYSSFTSQSVDVETNNDTLPCFSSRSTSQHMIKQTTGSASHITPTSYQTESLNLQKDRIGIFVEDSGGKWVTNTQVMEELVKLSIHNAFPLDKTIRTYSREYRKMACKDSIVDKYALLLRRTRLEMKNELCKILTCQSCVERKKKGCGIFYLVKRYLELLDKISIFYESTPHEELGKLFYEISFEFGPEYDKAIKCVKRKRYLKSKLGYSTMDYNETTLRSFRVKAYQQTLNPLEEIRNEFVLLKKQKERL